MFLSEASSFVAALLFSVHPVHTEAVRCDFYVIKSYCRRHFCVKYKCNMWTRFPFFEKLKLLGETAK